MKEYQNEHTVQKQIAEALTYRGYFISVREDGIYLSSANHKCDRESFNHAFGKSAVGISTITCCDGHGRRAPYVIFDGVHNGIWFELIQNYMMHGLELQYEWEVLPEQNEKYMRLQAKKKSHQHWDLVCVQQDSYTIAHFLLENMHELSNLKRKVFDGGIKPVKRMLKEMTLEEKKRWMTEKWVNYFQNVRQG